MRFLIIFCALSLLTGCDTIRNQLDGNQPPVIRIFEADPKEGPAPLRVAFSWETVDIEGDELTCILEYGTGDRSEVNNCAQITNRFHEYAAPGGNIAILSVSDSKNRVSKSITVNVLEAVSEAN